MTTVFPASEPPASIEEADIELNGVHFTWSAGEDAKPVAPLLPVLVHELGHVLGLQDAHPEEGRSNRQEGVMTGALAERPTTAEVDRVCGKFPRERR
jgi:hypothetical protein